MKKLFTLLGALLLWQTMAVSQSYLHISQGDSTIAVPIAQLDSVTVRSKLFYGYTDDFWVSIGVGTYREDLVSSLWGTENLRYEVEIQTVPEAPGLYRLVNPYGTAYPYNSPGDYDANRNHYMVIDAQDPDAVVLQKCHTSMNWGYGDFIFWSYADYYLSHGYSKEALINTGYYGTLKDGKITFPANSLLISMKNYNGGNFTTANRYGLFEVTLPGYYTKSTNVPARDRKPENVERNIRDKQLVPFTLEQKKKQQAPTMQRAVPAKKAEDTTPQQLMICPVGPIVK